MANATLVTNSSYSLEIHNLTFNQILVLKALVQNPINPETEDKESRNLREAIFNACKHVYL